MQSVSDMETFDAIPPPLPPVVFELMLHPVS